MVISERFRFHCSLWVLQRLIPLSAHVDINSDPQCDLFRLDEAERARSNESDGPRASGDAAPVVRVAVKHAGLVPPLRSALESLRARTCYLPRNATIANTA